jgi:hypothetical protein
MRQPLTNLKAAIEIYLQVATNTVCYRFISLAKLVLQLELF